MSIVGISVELNRMRGQNGMCVDGNEREIRTRLRPEVILPACPLR